MNRTPAFTLAAAFIVLGSTLSQRPSAAQPSSPGNITEARVSSEVSSGKDWLINGRDFGEQHFSPLAQITDKLLAPLRVRLCDILDLPLDCPSLSCFSRT